MAESFYGHWKKNLKIRCCIKNKVSVEIEKLSLSPLSLLPSISLFLFLFFSPSFSLLFSKTIYKKNGLSEKKVILTLSLISCRIFSRSSSILRCFSFRLSSASLMASCLSLSASSSFSLSSSSPPPSPPTAPVKTNHQIFVKYLSKI